MTDDPAFDLKSYLMAVRSRVDRWLRGYLGDSDTDPKILRAMSYSVMAGGKRLRPVLCIAAAQSVGGDDELVMPLACALEMIHTYSLIHDDLPAMDDDDMRRGNPTCHVKFDEPTAILAGDALLTFAFEILALAGSRRSHSQITERWLHVMAKVAAASGYQGMLGGQMQDMMLEGSSISAARLEALHRLKTGKMIEVSVESGAMIAGASDKQIQSLLGYAENIGLAFQVTDDILNVKGDPTVMGKATGTDKLRGKNTYPDLLGLDGAEAMAETLINNALKRLDGFDKRAEPLRAIARYVIERNR